MMVTQTPRHQEATQETGCDCDRNGQQPATKAVIGLL
jgi:hypothetical protein